MHVLIAIALAWNLLDHLLYGLPWMQRLVFSQMDPALWSKPLAGESSAEAEKRKMLWGAVITTLAAFVFVTLTVWLGLVGLSPFQGLVFGFLTWLAIACPIVLQDFLYFNTTRNFVLLHAGAWFLKLTTGGLLLSLLV